MLEAYTDVAVFIAMGALFVLLNMLVGKIIRPHRPYAEKLTTYECGEEPIGDAQIKFHARYYIYALVFVVFDVETIYLYPWAVVLREMGLYAFILMAVFLIMLLDGLIYAWKKGALKWV